MDLRADGRLVPDVEVIGDERGHEILLAHDVLNQLCVLLDGPAEIVKVLDEQPE